MTDQDPTQPFEAPPAPPAPATSVPPPAPGAFPVYAPADAPAPTATTPVTPTAKGPGRSKARWVAAGVLTLVVAGTAAAGTLLLTGSSGDPSVLAYTPANSVAYTELRLDLPGDQRAELAEVMQAFPGFDDQAAFPTKLNEALDQLVSRASDGEQTWTADIEPWFGGQLALSVGALPTSAEDAGDTRALVLVSVKDGAKATAWVDELVTHDGATTATETYNGVTITTVTPPAGSPAMAKAIQAGYAIVGPVLALGDVGSVKAAIDTNGKTGLATNEQFKAASATLSGDRLAFAYVDNQAIREATKDLVGAMASDAPALPSTFDAWMAPWSAAAVRAKDSAFVIEARAPHVDAAGPAKHSESKLPSLLPPSTVALAEGHDVGEQVERIRSLLAEDPKLADGLKDVENTLALIGGLDAITGWMGEVGVAVTADGDTIGGGVVVTPTDPAAAERLFGQLKAFIQLGGASQGLKLTEEDYQGTTITVLDLGGLGEAAGQASGLPVGDLGDVQIAYVVTDDVVALGTADFVKGVLDARDGASLADSARFSAALDRAGKAHSALLWVDVQGIVGFAEGRVKELLGTDYDTATKPYLQAFDSVIGTTVPGDDIDSATLIISVSKD